MGVKFYTIQGVMSGKVSLEEIVQGSTPFVPLYLVTAGGGILFSSVVLWLHKQI